MTCTNCDALGIRNLVGVDFLEFIEENHRGNSKLRLKIARMVRGSGEEYILNCYSVALLSG